MTARRMPITLAAVVLTLAAAVAAHEGGSNGYAAIAVQRDTIRYSLTLWPAALPAPVASQIMRAREGDAGSRDALIGFVRDKVALTAHGQRCQPGAAVDLPPNPATDSLTLIVNFACTGAIHTLTIRDDLFDVFGADYHTLARIDLPHRTAQFAFSPEAREATLTLERAPAGDVLGFVRLGVEHILDGWDHLLFLLVLLLRGGHWLSLAKIITAFTLAHSVTLALAALDVIVLPDRLVEAIIALSIAVVAAENLFLRPVVVRRWLVSFAFGLVHGFGFSSVLRELGLPTQGLLLSLFGFNAGVELGQAAVVAVALPLLALVRKTRWERRVIWSSSAAILLVGVFLFVDRAFS
ncbi:MAG TPA: HupE/UreJ family protein [Methylomirabilota bacterium]|jgi:hypothetical protein